MSSTKFQTYDINAIAEDVSDIISRISPQEVRFQEKIGKGRIHDVYHRWQTVELKPADPNNAAIQGAEFVDNVLTPTVEQHNRTQIFTKVINVAETADAVKIHGKRDETAFQWEMKAREARIDLETVLLSGQNEVTGSSNTASRMKSAQMLIDPSLRLCTGSPAAAPTKAQVKDVMKKLRTGGAKVTDLLINVSESDVPGQWLRETAGEFVRQVPNSGEASHGVTDYVDYVITPTGRLDIALHDFILGTDYLFHAPKTFTLETLRPWKTVSLAKTADANRLGLVGEFSLSLTNPKAAAVLRRADGTNF